MTKYPTLFSTDSAKAAKASGFGYLNAIHYMAPATLGGAGNMCSHYTLACLYNCLGWQSGQASMVKDLDAGMNNVRESRKLKAQLFMRDRAEYMNRLARDIVRLERKARKDGLKLCVRLNGSSDLRFERISFDVDAKTMVAIGLLRKGEFIPWKRVTLLELFPAIQFVDYTKNPNRLDGSPGNLDLTLSYSVENDADCVKALLSGHNVAMIFDGGLPESFAGFPVINGDLHDLRHLDTKGGHIVGLTPKGRRAKKDITGFIIRKGEAFNALENHWRALRVNHEISKRKALTQAAIDSGKLLIIAA
jgi:hypothetical protein